MPEPADSSAGFSVYTLETGRVSQTSVPSLLRDDALEGLSSFALVRSGFFYAMA